MRSRQATESATSECQDAASASEVVAGFGAEAHQRAALEGAVILRLAQQIDYHCQNIEAARASLFRPLHPNRDHFEKVGRPGDAASEAAESGRRVRHSHNKR